MHACTGNIYYLYKSHGDAVLFVQPRNHLEVGRWKTERHTQLTIAMALVHNDGNQLDAHLELYRNAFAFIKAMALKSALDLRIADIIDQHGGAATLTQLAADLTLHPSKIPCLRRLMRTLAVSGVFTVLLPAVGAADEPVYMLTPLSRLLVGSSNLVPIMSMLLHPTIVTPFLGIGKWFQNELPPDQYCIFKQTHGESVWELAGYDTAFDALMNDAMVSDSNFIMDIVVKEHGEVFQGLSSLVDVGGGLGAAAHAISKAFPEVKCSVLDLGHVVAKAPVVLSWSTSPATCLRAFLQQTLSSSSGFSMTGAMRSASRYLRTVGKPSPPETSEER
ncbi:hypothetical protein ABZP36_014482 [Zizania latifolia]